MALLAGLMLAAKEGSIIAAIHSAIQWLVGGWVLANKQQFVCLVSGYSIFFYILNFCFSASQQTPAVPNLNSWLGYFSNFASGMFEPLLGFGVMHMYVPWIPTTRLPSHAVSRPIQSYSIISWVFEYGLAMPHHMLNSGISFLAEPHMMHRAHQLVTTTAAAWFIVRHINDFLHNHPTKVINESPSTEGLYVNGSNEQQHIYWTVREIATNCSTHWRKQFTWGCHLEEGAPPEQMRKLELLLDVKFPDDYKTFLQLTNGLKNVLDGSKPHLTFLPANSPIFTLSSIYQEPSSEMRRLHTTWVVESLFGPGTRAKLMEQTGRYGGSDQYGIKLIKIASRDNESGGVFLVSPKDVQYTVGSWFELALDHRKRNGALIGSINYHIESYFGSIGHRIEMLKDWEEWLVLQVQEQELHNSSWTRCRLYPSFTAFLQTLAEITRRSTAFLISGSLNESYYADQCRWRWEWVWDRKLEEGEIRLIVE